MGKTVDIRTDGWVWEHCLKLLQLKSGMKSEISDNDNSRYSSGDLRGRNEDRRY